MRLVAVIAVLVLGLSAADARAAARPRLKAFASCKQLVAYARDGARRTHGGVGVVGRAVAPPADAIVRPAPPSARGELAPAAAQPEDTSFSGTNVQELGVDEPDVMKTDGRRLFAVTDGTLRVVDLESGALTATLPLAGFDHRLLLRGDRLLVIAARGGVRPLPGRPIAVLAPIAPTATVVTELDVSRAPEVLRTMTVPGRFVDARQHGGTARLVVDAAPAPIAPADVASAGRRRFLGRTVLHSDLTGRTYRRDLAPCGAVRRPRAFSGLGVLAVLTVDLDRGLYSLDRDGVMAGAEVVYGSPDSLYVASRRYIAALDEGGAVPGDVRTEIDRFDISDPDHTVYRSSGSVPGFILNSYALSEYKGDLRVASTEGPPWLDPDSSASRLTVLREHGARLDPVGSVGGLGRGERIYAVRFMGDKAFVVTFRQVDPLYALDLHDPTAPAVRGALEIAGYSAYLHPISDTLLLGIGRQGQAVQASLFDVADLAAPRRLSHVSFGPGSTPVELEPHAFLYWAASDLAVLPLGTDGDPPFLGAVGLRARAGAPLAELIRITHPGGAPVERAFAARGRLYTLSYAGLAANALDGLKPLPFVPFP